MGETERIPMKTNYKDLTIWITGASSGIGEALTIAFAKTRRSYYSKWT